MPIRVLQFVPGVMYRGGETYALSLTHALQRNGVQASLALTTDGEVAAAARRLGVNVEVILKRGRGDLTIVAKLARLLRQRKIDIIHTHLANGNFYGRLAARMAGVKGVVSTFHYKDREALGAFERSYVTALIYHLDLWMCRFSHRIIALSEGLKEDLVAKGVARERIVAIPQGLDVRKYTFSSPVQTEVRRELGVAAHLPLVGVAGRLVPVKNFSFFLEVARRVLNSGVQAKFLVIGEGPLRSDLEQYAARLGVATDVIFTGWRSDLPRLLSALTVFVNCSSSEALPYVAMEAMAAGRPVVVSAVGAMPELVEHNQTGFVLPLSDQVAFVEAISLLTRNPTLANRMGERARIIVQERYSEDRMVERIRAVYQSLLGQSVAAKA